MATVHVILPDSVDDLERPSGGNRYDRRLCQQLAADGWSVREHLASGTWPTPASSDVAGLHALVAGIPDGSVLLVDGLVASASPEVMVPQTQRLRVVVLLHMPLGEDSAPGAHRDRLRESEAAVLSAVAAVVTPSAWSRRQVLQRQLLPPDRVQVAAPGVDPAPLAAGTPGGGELLCVAAVAPHKGHDLLLAALTEVADRSWTCSCVGRLDLDRSLVDRVRAQARAGGVAARMRFTGPLSETALHRAYDSADLLVHPSRGETFGMVVTEALARGLPVLASAVGGIPEALGHQAGGDVPGILVPPEDAAALAEALRTWLHDPALRRRLRRSARHRRETLSGWRVTAEQVGRVLREVR